MSFILQNKIWFRTFVIILFIISMLGIWSFDLIPFPIPISSSCDTYNSLVGKSFLSEEHFIRLNDNNCIITISGFEIIYLLTLQIFSTFIELIKGNFATVQIPQLIAMIGILLIVLPFFSNILLFRNRYSRRLQITNVIAWGLPCLFTLSVFLLDAASRAEIIRNFYLLWGLWLYILLALSAIVFEILALKSDNKSSMAI